MRITEDMTIGEVIKTYPATAEVMISHGVHCVGCHVSFMESIGEGLRGHGFSQEKVETIMKELNEAAEQSEKMKNGATLVVTKKAADKLKEILKEEGKPKSGLRVQVTRTSCCKSEYSLEIDENKKEQDEVHEEHGIKFYINNKNLQVVKGSRIDLVGESFRITNPNTSTCTCGKC